MSVFVPQIFISYIKTYTNNINKLYKIIFKSYQNLLQLSFLSAFVSIQVTISKIRMLGYLLQRQWARHIKNINDKQNKKVYGYDQA